MDPQLPASNHQYDQRNQQQSRHPHSDQSSSSKLGLPNMKGSLAPAEITLSQHSHDNNKSTKSPTSPGSFHDSIPRDYFHLHHHDMNLKSMDSTTTNEHYKYQKEGLSKVSEILQKTVDSPPGTPTSEFSAATSPFSSTESLASLIERQNQSKINHPGHQAFNSSRKFLSPSRKKSNASIFSVFNASHSRTNSSQFIRSPLSEKRNPFNGLLTTSSSSSTRKLEPTASNPHHIHSSPEVKESNHVSLEYDPVSKRKVLNSYEIIKEIGRGEHGKVKLARDLIKDELVAIKIVDRKGRPKLGASALSGGPTAEDKIRKEIAIMKKCCHPNVVKLREVLDDVNSRKIYLVLEYLEKGEIKWRKSPGEPALTLPQTLSAFRDVVLGLEYLHYQGIIHRDIKPANLLVCADNSVKISDFGVSFAASLNGDDQNELELCKSAGTPAFFAPELCWSISNESKERPKITHKIDVWALGVTLYGLLFGDLPFWGGNEFELFDTINEKELKFPKEFPKNYEWAEEEIFQAKNLLNKMLEKDPVKRIGLKSIKRHPFVLRNLSVEEAKQFTGEQKSCESKIHVSNEEVKVAVTGIAGKIRKGFVKALKLAGLGPKRESHPPDLTKARTSADIRPNLLDQKSKSQSYNLHDSSTKSLTFAEYELNKINSHVRSPLARSGTISRTNSNREGRHHRRVKSGETSGLATRATVEGDLFLNKSSAFNALSGIMDNDRRRSSVASFGGQSSTSETIPSTSNGSSLDNGTQLVSLPVNASFASLDSIYLDNYATRSYSSASGPKADKQIEEPNPRDFFKKMNSFSLNRTTEMKVDDAVAPHDPPATFSLAAGDEDDDDEDELGDDEDDDEEDDHNVSAFIGSAERSNSTGGAAKRMDSNVSQYSVPSYLANELQASKSITDEATPDIVISRASRSNTPLKPQRKFSSPKRGSTPKYSFFGGSSDESDSSASSFPKRRRKSSSLISPSEGGSTDEELRAITHKHESESESESDSDSDSDSDGDGDNDELTLVLGSRRSSRINSVAVASLNRPNSEPKPTLDDSDSDISNRVPTRSVSALRNSVSQIERVSSPLSRNAPKTPIANSNAHLFPHVPVNKNEYVNHYNKEHITAPITKTRYFGGVSSLDEVLNDRQRSNSVTVGLLNKKSAEEASTTESTSD